MIINTPPAQRSALLVSLLTELGKLVHQRSKLEQVVTAEAVEAWKELGGCVRCAGFEVVVTWSTMDGPGWTEYGACPECTPESRLLGRMPGASRAYGYSTYDEGHINWKDMSRTDGALWCTLDAMVLDLEERVQEEDRNCAVDRGRKVVVFKGRKVPVGTTGECFWIGAGQYGVRVGIKDSKGEVYWTALDNVKVTTATEVAA